MGIFSAHRISALLVVKPTMRAALFAPRFCTVLCTALCTFLFVVGCKTDENAQNAADAKNTQEQAKQTQEMILAKARQDLAQVQMYAPLHVGDVWSYRMTPARMGLSSWDTKIISVDEQGFFVDDKKGKLRAQPLGLSDGERFLFQTPLKVGNTWMATLDLDHREQYRVTAVDAHVSVPAGEFDHCLVVEGKNEIARYNPISKMADTVVTIQNTWYYAPHVGLVKFVQTAPNLAQSMKLPQTMTLELTSYSINPQPDAVQPAQAVP